MSISSHLLSAAGKVSKGEEKHESKGERLREMRIEHGTGGGYIVSHHGKDMMDSKKFPIKSSAELIRHVKDHMC